MRKLSIIAVMAIAALTATAQNTLREIGTITVQPKVGLTMGSISGDYTLGPDENAKMRFGIVAGVDGEFYPTTWLGLSTGLHFAQQGWKLGDRTTKLDYLNIPVLANFYMADGLALKTGVQPGFLLNAKENGNDIKDDCKHFNFSIPVGISYEYQNFVLDARYNISLTRANKETGPNNDKYRSDLVTLTIGYKFSL